MRGNRAERGRAELRSVLDQVASQITECAPPLLVVDLDAFDANADDLARRAAGTPIRVASKSLRIPALIDRVLRRPGFSGILAFGLREALWLVDTRISDDIVMGYPCVDVPALTALLETEDALRRITLMVDSPAHLDLIDSLRTAGQPAIEVRIALDIDAGLRAGPAHLGPKRSPLADAEQVIALARTVTERNGFRLTGVMTYEGQVAGLPDDVPGQRLRSALIRGIKSRSVQQLGERRAAIAAALGALQPLEFWNAGGSGSIEVSAADPSVTEVAAGSGLLVPTLFDHYRSFEPRPAAFFAVPVVRKPRPDLATVAGGGLIASGPVGADRAPTPWAPPGLRLTGMEGAGEVQTPLTGPGAAALQIGDLVWFRHAKSGEVTEHVALAHLAHLSTPQEPVVAAPTYRGLGAPW